MNVDAAETSIAQSAENRWNAEADEFNQWAELGQDEKDALIADEQERLASTTASRRPPKQSK